MGQPHPITERTATMSSKSQIRRRDFVAGAAALAASPLAAGAIAHAEETQTTAPAGKQFRVGAYAKDITPTSFPAICGGLFEPRLAYKAYSPLFARCLVLDDGDSRVAIVIVDAVGITRDLYDGVKEKASKSTGIPVERILIAATHDHAVPCVMPALDVGVDENYTAYLPGCLVETIEKAAANMVPARIGWTVAKAHDFNDCRQGIFPPDEMGVDPYGEKTTRAMMHCSGLGPAGPADPDLSLVAFQSLDGTPIALLGNFAMHYFDSSLLVSGDACGTFGKVFAKQIGADEDKFVGILSQGYSGDAFWQAYHKPQPKFTLDTYTEGLAKVALEAYKKIEYHDWLPLAMDEHHVTLGRRMPDEKRLKWATDMLDNKIQGVSPWSLVYAKELVCMITKPKVELRVQAIRLGDLGITALPCEVYALTGMKLKAMSPTTTTVNIALANGCEGYIPPPEQHKLGGYTTWPSRTTGLEVQTEPKLVEELLQMLEKLTGKPRRTPDPAVSPYAKAVLASKPAANWRLREMCPPVAADSSGRNIAGQYEDFVAFYLEGPDSPGCAAGPEMARAMRCVGGRMKAEVPDLGDTYSVEFWFWNALPVDKRDVTGYMFSRAGAKDSLGDQLSIGGRTAGKGKLVFTCGDGNNVTGKTTLALRTWYHVVLVREGSKVTVYLDGNTTPELAGQQAAFAQAFSPQFLFGGRTDNYANFEGKIAEVALYDRALTGDEAAAHYAAAKAAQ